MVPKKSGYTFEKDLLKSFVGYLNSIGISNISLEVYTNRLSCAIGNDVYRLITTAYTYYFDCICKKPNNLFGLRFEIDYSVAVASRFILITRDRSFYLSNKKAFYTIYELYNPDEIRYITERLSNISTEYPIMKKL